MTKEEAREIINSCKQYNMSQKSISLAFNGVRTSEDDIYEARREALRKAWLVIGEARDELS